MKLAAIAVALLLIAPGVAKADALTADDYKYLQSVHGLTQQSAVVAELTPNEQQALHSAIDDLKTYPEGRDRQVRRYLALVYSRECKRWVEKHQGEALAGRKSGRPAGQAAFRQDLRLVSPLRHRVSTRLPQDGERENLGCAQGPTRVAPQPQHGADPAQRSATRSAGGVYQFAEVAETEVLFVILGRPAGSDPDPINTDREDDGSAAATLVWQPLCLLVPVRSFAAPRNDVH